MRDHIVERLRDVVLAHRETVAISTAGEPAFTYGELWTRALAISCALAESGGVVAIYMEKSPDLVAAMIGTWLAGLAFMPILPELPEARRIAILDETRCSDAIVASDRVPADLRARCRIVDSRLAATSTAAAAATATDVLISPISEPDVATPARPGAIERRARSTSDRAYIIYTSGSTGRPKGVVVPHRGLVNLLDAQIATFDLRAGDRCLWMLSPSFDASISDVFTALLAGATLHIEHPARMQSPSNLLGVLRQRGITHIDLPPSLLPLLSVADAPPSLRTVVIGGEVCAPAAVRAWSSRVRLVNVYGPTEATVCSTLCVCDPSWNRPLIGRPLPNVELRIVDDELWIGGIGIADGYVTSPELEAAKFVSLEGVRWFRTGDRVVEHAYGEIEFLGRVDRQLKVQGVLVAPEEIEARLREHPSIADAVVVLERGVLEARDGTRDMLVAYCVSSGSVPTATAVREHLSRTLDRRLIPRRLVFVDAFPRTTSGKIEVAALTRTQSLDEATLVRKQLLDEGGLSAAELALAHVWQRLLGADSIRREDNFFDLGGDSFAVVELLAMAELAGLPLSADDVYEAPVLADLARCADEGGRGVARSCSELIADVSPLVGRTIDAATCTADSVLLTGATGFLGVHVLAELIARSVSVTCIVRAVDDVAARSRVAAALECVVDGGALRERFDTQVTCITGDVRAPRFGGERWSELGERIDTIVHCAADVSVTRPYAELRASNVEGTARVLELAAAGRAKRVHYASTLSVFVGGERDGVLAEEDPLESAVRLYGGYAQSKWAAEWLVRRVDPSAAIYRFGLLTGDTRDGRGAERDWLTWFVRGLAAVGGYPRIGETPRVDVTPVDYASRAMVRLVLDGARGTFHVANPRSATLAELVGAIRRAGVALREVTIEELGERVAAERDSVVALLGACRAGDSYSRVRACDVFQASGVTFDMRRTEAALAGSGIACPPPTEALLDAYVARMLEGV